MKRRVVQTISGLIIMAMMSGCIPAVSNTKNIQAAPIITRYASVTTLTEDKEADDSTAEEVPEEEAEAAGDDSDENLGIEDIIEEEAAPIVEAPKTTTPKAVTPASTVKKLTPAQKTAAKRKEVVSYALRFVGNPYRYGGTSLTKGTDCSGFTMSVYKKFGVSLPHSSRAQATKGKTVSLSKLQPGDLIFYTHGSSRINHVAMYIGNGKVVHASTKKTGIKISKYNYSKPYKAVSLL